MQPDYYATLGVGRRATLAQIRAAYRLLAAEHHPDRHPDSPEAVSRMQELNAAHETLSDPRRRRLYDRDIDDSGRDARAQRTGATGTLSQDVYLPIEAFFRGTLLNVAVNDPASTDGTETYPLEVPPDTSPGSRFRLARHAGAGFVQVRLKVLPGYRFKASGSDLKCDLRISADRAGKGGSETMPGPAGRMIRIEIPARVARGTVLRIPREGLPKPRGGRGDLLVKITYRPAVHVTRLR